VLMRCETDVPSGPRRWRGPMTLETAVVKPRITGMTRMGRVFSEAGRGLALTRRVRRRRARRLIIRAIREIRGLNCSFGTTVLQGAGWVANVTGCARIASPNPANGTWAPNHAGPTMLCGRITGKNMKLALARPLQPAPVGTGG